MRLNFQPGTVAFFNHYYPGEIGINGLGDTNPINLTASAASVAGTVMTSMAPFLAVGSAIPIVGEFIMAGAGIAIAAMKLFSGCGQTCVQTSNAANQAGDMLEQLVHNYVANPVRTVSMQSAALTAFDHVWAALEQTCSNPQFAAAGQRCITDRQRGACTWKASPGGWNPDGTYTFAGKSGSGDTCWNWFVGYRDPIANDPFVIPDSQLAGPAPVNNTTTSANSIIPVQSSPAGGAVGAAVNPVNNQSVSGIPLPLILGGGALLLLLAVNR